MFCYSDLCLQNYMQCTQDQKCVKYIIKMLKIDKANEFVVLFCPSYLCPQNYMHGTQD